MFQLIRCVIVHAERRVAQCESDGFCGYVRSSFTSSFLASMKRSRRELGKRTRGKGSQKKKRYRKMTTTPWMMV